MAKQIEEVRTGMIWYSELLETFTSTQKWLRMTVDWRESAAHLVCLPVGPCKTSLWRLHSTQTALRYPLLYSHTEYHPTKWHTMSGILQSGTQHLSSYKEVQCILLKNGTQWVSSCKVAHSENHLSLLQNDILAVTIFPDYTTDILSCKSTEPRNLINLL